MISIVDIRDFITDYVAHSSQYVGLRFKSSSIDIEWELSKLSWWFCLDSKGSSPYLIEFNDTSYGVRLKLTFLVKLSEESFQRDFKSLEKLGADVSFCGLYKDSLRIESFITDLTHLTKLLNALCTVLSKYR